MNSLEKLRGKVNDEDQKILQALVRRFETVNKIKDLKDNSSQSYFDPERETFILNSIKKKTTGLPYQDEILEIYQKLLSSSLSFMDKTGPSAP